jgi:hypothetical protein
LCLIGAVVAGAVAVTRQNLYAVFLWGLAEALGLLAMILAQG